MGAPEVTKFLTSLAVDGQVAASIGSRASAGATTCTSRSSSQELLGPRDVSTTVSYTRVLKRGPAAVRSPADRMFAS